MTYIALDQTQLSRFSYHWFWGLRFDSGSKNTLYDAVRRLQNDDLLRQEIEEQIESLGHRGWFIRSVCWLFNLGQYRQHFYQLQAYRSWQLYQEVISMFPESMGLPSAVIVSAGSALVTGLIYASITTPSLAWFSQKIVSYFSPEEARLLPEEAMTDEAEEGVSLAATSPSPQASPTFMVRPSMIPLLETLGITSLEGEAVSLEALKLAYRASCLRTHPDKGITTNHEEFTAVRSAWNRLQVLLENKATVVSYFEGSGSLYDYLRDRDERTEVLKTYFQEMQTNWGEISRSCNEMSRRWDELSRREDDISRRQDEISRRQDEMRAREQELNKAIQEERVLMQREIEISRRLDVEIEKLMVRLQELTEAENAMKGPSIAKTKPPNGPRFFMPAQAELGARNILISVTNVDTGVTEDITLV